MSDPVGNPEDRFSRVAAHIMVVSYPSHKFLCKPPRDRLPVPLQASKGQVTCSSASLQGTGYLFLCKPPRDRLPVPLQASKGQVTCSSASLQGTGYLFLCKPPRDRLPVPLQASKGQVTCSSASLQGAGYLYLMHLSFTINRQILFLNQENRKNGHRNMFINNYLSKK